MGYAKYGEDIWLFKTERENEKGYKFKYPVIAKVFPCRYCQEKFKSQEELYEHIRLKHNSISLIVYINGKIINDDMRIYECYSATVRCFNDNGVIAISGEKIKLSKNENLDIEKKINELLSKNGIVELSFSNKQFLIKKLEKDDINNSLIKKIVMKWNKEIKDKLPLTQPSSFSGLNNEEQELLNGIYDYYIGCKLKPIEDQDKINRYNDAISLLQDFVDISPIALFIIQTIALKYNWYETFIQLNKVSSSDYYYVYSYIANVESKELPRDDINVDNYIYIDEELKEIIDLIKAYQNKIPGYEKMISGFDESKLSNNGQYTICWLKARTYLGIDKKKASGYYEEISNICELIKKEREKVGV